MVASCGYRALQGGLLNGMAESRFISTLFCDMVENALVTPLASIEIAISQLARTLFSR